MEAHLRRLWPRRKSLKNTAKPDAEEVPSLPSRPVFHYSESYEATPSGPPPQVGTVPFKPSNHTTSKKLFGHSKAQSAGLQELQTVSDKHVPLRSKSTGGIQPILIGISRPMTSEAFPKEVIDASNLNRNPAPTPAGHRLNTSASLPEPRKAQSFQPLVKRHVDIMSFAAANGKYLEGYNEEVAARNLDLKTLANASATTTYVPRSKYQADVASRNAARMGYRYKPSAPMQSVPESRRSNSLDSKTALSTTIAATPYRHEGATVHGKTRSMQQSTAHHSRNGSGTSKPANVLPAIPQEISFEDAERTIPWLNKQSSVTSQPNERTAESRSAFTRYPSMRGRDVLPTDQATPPPPPPLPKMTTRANQSRPIANVNPREYGHPLQSNPYEPPVAGHAAYARREPVPREEQLQTSRTGSRSSRQPLQNGVPLSRTSSADPGRPSSSLNYSGNVGNRTFLDLVEDEPERHGQFESPDTEYLESPILAQATADMVEVHRAQLVGTARSPYQDLTSPSDTVDHGTVSTGSSVLNRNSKRWSTAFSDTGSTRSEQPLAFSTVTTVSSMSPASQLLSGFNSSDESSRIERPRERNPPGSVSHRATSLDVARPGSSEDGAGQRNAMTFHSLGNTRSPAIQTQKPTSVYAEQQDYLNAETPHVLHTSPESLNSGDFTDPSRAFGVLTRDFASTPSRQSTARQQPPRHKSRTNVPGYPARPEVPTQTSQSTIQREQKHDPRRHLRYEHKSNGHELPSIREPSRSPQFDHVDTPTKELTADSFDEAEFARKQAQARAALLRLQMSLEEQYDMSPGRPDSSAQRHVARQILDQTRKPPSEEKQRSAPPTSMHYEKKEYQSRARTSRPAPLRSTSEDMVKSGSGYSYEKAGPNSFAQTVYSAVTIGPSRPHPNGHTRSSSAGSANHSYNIANEMNTDTGTRALSTLSNPPLTPVLPSPSGTEVSLSSFPMPQSPDHRGRRPATEPDRPRTARMHSTKSSVGSIASVYSIPHHMVPARDSSRRDAFEEEA